MLWRVARNSLHDRKAGISTGGSEACTETERMTLL